jgi:hypothetical protein
VALSGREYHDVMDVAPHVTVSGTRSYDVVEMDGRTPLVAYPIYEALDPIDVGGVGDWLMELIDRARPNEIAAVQGCVDTLKTQGIDLLTYLRAARWAVQQRSGDAEAALREGLAATDKVRRLREIQAAVAAAL